MLTHILARSSWRFYRQHPAQLLLSIIGIVLGVGVVCAVLITNNSSQRAFALSTEALYGNTTHELSGANGVDQQFYVELRKRFTNMKMAPVIAGNVAINDEVYSLLGLDPFAEFVFNRASNAPFSNPTANQQSSGSDDNRFTDLLRSNALLVSETSAKDNQLAIGQSINIDVAGQKHSAYLAATYSSDNPVAATGLLVGDIAFVQKILQRGDRISRIDLILDNEQEVALQQYLPKTLQLKQTGSRTDTMRAMTRGFHINLTAMSLLALLVGIFLIHNTMTFAVVQRRELFAIKRITGITSRTLMKNILIEAVAISSLASMIGIALGYFLSSALVKLTTRTINDLYFVLHVQEVWFSPWLIVLGLALGIGSSVIAASIAALDAASTNPVQARQRSLIEERSQRVLPLLAMTGIVIMALGALLSIVPLQSLVAGFIAMMLIILGFGLLIPWMVLHITRGLKPFIDKLGISLSLAAGGIYRNISRTGLAIAALSIAVSATFGVDVMIGSFRSSVDNWLKATLQSDIYITAPAAVSTQTASMLAPDSFSKATSISGVVSVSSGRTLQVSTSVGDISMLVIKPHNDEGGGFELLETDGDNPWKLWTTEQGLMVSEPLATKHNLQAGDAIELFTQTEGFVSFDIAAIFRDYGSSQGKLLMARDVFDRYWQAPGISSLGVVLEKPDDVDSVIDQLRATLSSSARPLRIQSNTTIHEQSLIVFDRTFEVTRVLRWLTVGVAFVGIFSALLALHLERAKEFAILRASGATRQAVIMIVMAQTFIMGLLAGALALPLGWMMSEVLIKVINLRSFGWSMQSILPVDAIGETLVLAIASAMLAGIYPAYKLSRSGIAEQLRDD